jgi:hypothetical protein
MEIDGRLVNLYLIEMGGRTIAGFVRIEDLYENDSESENFGKNYSLDEMYTVDIFCPAMISLSMLPVQGNIAMKQPQMGIATIVMPYHVEVMTICMENISGFSCVPDTNPIQGQMLEIIKHFENPQKPEKGFNPVIVK